MNLKETNILFVTKHDSYNIYSSVNVNNHKVTRMNGKGCKDNDYVYTGLCYIYDYKQFWNQLTILYESNPMNMVLSDIHSIEKMIETGINFEYTVVNSYLDTGNINSYTQTCQQFISKYNILVKETESLCFVNDRVIKFINDKETNRKRIIRGYHLYPYVPKIIDVRDNFIAMDFVKGDLLSDSKRYGEIYNLLEWAQEKLWKSIHTNDKYNNSCLNFYKKKTLDRVHKIPFLSNEIAIVNGKDTGNILSMINNIDFSMLCTNKFAKFHGDFILDNIIKTSETEYCLLDWRHEFDSELYYGDIYYDLAKLRHNMIVNHYNIVHNLYSIDYKDKEVVVDLKCNYSLMVQLDEYNSFITKYNYNRKKIEILTALIWLNMAPLYEGKLREFLFYFGKFNLYITLYEEVRPY
jgi:thiamine kinase-like enzyme